MKRHIIKCLAIAALSLSQTWDLAAQDSRAFKQDLRREPATPLGAAALPVQTQKPASDVDRPTVTPQGTGFLVATTSYQALFDGIGMRFAPDAHHAPDATSVDGTVGLRFDRVRREGVDLWRAGPSDQRPLATAEGKIVYVHGEGMATVYRPRSTDVKVSVVVGSAPAGHGAFELVFAVHNGVESLKVQSSEDAAQEFPGTGQGSVVIGRSVAIDALGASFDLAQDYDPIAGTLTIRAMAEDLDRMHFPVEFDPPVGTVQTVGNPAGQNEFADVAYGAGQYLSVWHNGGTIWGRFMSPSGTFTSFLFIIGWSYLPSGVDAHPSVCFSPSANVFVVAWEGAGYNRDIFVARVTPSAVVSSQVNLSSSLIPGNPRHEAHPDVGAVGGDGGVVVVFEADYVTDRDIEAFQLDPWAQPTTGSYRFLPFTFDDETSPAICRQVLMSTEDDVGIVWVHTVGGQGDIEYAIVDDADQTFTVRPGYPVWVSQDARDEREPDIAGDDPTFTIVYSELYQSGGIDWDVRRRCVTGTSVGAALYVAATFEPEISPCVTAHPLGDTLVAYQRRASVGFSDIQVRRYDPSCALVESGTLYGGVYARPQIAADPACPRYLIVFDTAAFNSPISNILGQRWDNGSCSPPACAAVPSLSSWNPGPIAPGSAASQSFTVSGAGGSLFGGSWTFQQQTWNSGISVSHSTGGVGTVLTLSVGPFVPPGTYCGTLRWNGSCFASSVTVLGLNAQIPVCVTVAAPPCQPSVTPPSWTPPALSPGGAPVFQTFTLNPNTGIITSGTWNFAPQQWHGGLGTSLSNPTGSSTTLSLAPGPGVPAGTYTALLQWAGICNGQPTSTTSTVSVTVQQPALTIGALFPSSGPTTGGTLVTITGSGFAGGAWTGVWFNGVAASNVQVLTDNQLTCTAPPFPGGPLASTVYVTKPWSFAFAIGAFHYAPTTVSISSLTPNSGSCVGGTSVIVHGSGFVPGGTVVWINGVPATNIQVLSNTQISCTTPPYPGGSYAANVTVGTVLGGVAHRPGGFNYASSIALQSVGPTLGPVTGGSLITLTGSGFSGGWTGVWINGLPASNVQVISDTQILCVTPPYSVGPLCASIVVAKPCGSAYLSGFCYQ